MDRKNVEKFLKEYPYLAPEKLDIDPTAFEINKTKA